MNKNKVDTSYYQTVPEHLVQNLANFRQNNPLYNMDVNKHQWTYYALGHPDDEVLLLLHGGGGDAEAMFQYMQEFSSDFRVIAPNIPITINKLNDAMSGLRALLAHEGITRANVVGFSFGAMLAQMYIRKFQDTVINMVITHSTIPSKHLTEAINMQKNLMRFYPEPLLLGISKRAYHNHIATSTSTQSDAQKQFWQAYFDDLYSNRVRKKQLISRAKITVDYHSENEFNSRDLLTWDGDMLIIESENDNVITEGDRGSLKAMYSRAYIQTLADYDHLAPLLAQDEMISSIMNFLLKEDI